MRIQLTFHVVAVMAIAGCIIAGCNLSGSNTDQAYPSRPLTIICPWAAGGGTDRVSRQIAMQLEQRLDQPVTVINATGGKGVTGHSRGLTARPDGHTLTMMTFELNTMHWAGLTDLTYEDCVPLVSVNEDYAALLVRKDSTWNSIRELESAIAENPKQLTASGTALGGAWHLALAGWLVSAELDADAVTWVPSAGANPSLQQLLSGGVDMVCCSLPEARTMLESDQIRSLGVMSPKRAIGFEQIPTFAEQGRDWTLGGWRGLAVPVGTPTSIVERLRTVLEEIVREPSNDGSFALFMDIQKFDRTWRSSEDFQQFLADNDRKLGELLQSEAMRSVNQDRFSPVTYPAILIGLIGVSTIGLWHRRGAKDTSTAEANATHPTETNWWNVVWVVAAIAAYAQFAEFIGFMVITIAIVFGLLLRFQTNLLTSIFVTLITVPAAYGLFAVLLRVPLP